MYEGTWNASTNTPTIVSSVGSKGDYYVVATAGSTNINGITDWKIGDWIIFNGTTWDKVDNTDAVSSVNGYTGAVSLVTNDIAESTNLYFTNARAIGSTLTGYTSGSGVVAATDTILQAIQKLNGNVSGLVTGVSSVFGRTGAVSATSGDYNTSQVTENTNLYYTEGRVSANTDVAANTAARHAAVTIGTANGLSLSTQALSLALASGSATGALSSTDWNTFNNKLSTATAASTYVPYTGATGNVTLGTNSLTAGVGSFASSGGSDTFTINHSSGSGIALNITKGGNGEGLYINKTSGTGNAATIIGTLNATTLVKSGGTSSQFLKADGSVDSSTYLTTSAASSTYLPLAGGTLTGALSGTSATFSSTLQVGGTGSSTITIGDAVGSAADSNLRLRTGSTKYSWLIASQNNVAGFEITPSTAVGGTTYSTPAFTILPTGNVGIGTTSPSNKLTTIGSETGTQITTNPIGKFVNTGNSFSKLIVGSDNANYDAVISMDNNATLANCKLRFYIGNGTNSTLGHSIDQIVLQGNGNVGIGTSSPDETLQVNGSVRALQTTNTGIAQIYADANNGTSLRCGLATFGSSASSDLLGIARASNSFLYKNGGALAVGTGSAQPLILSTNDTERMRIRSNGSVGINSAGVDAIKLVIKGDSDTSSNFAIALSDLSTNDLFYVRCDGYMNTGNRASSPYNLTSGVAANMVVGSDGTLYRSTSSLKYKTNVRNYDKGLEDVMKIRPVYYNSKNEREKGIQFAGLIAEEVHELGLTEFVQYTEDGTPDALAYQNMIALAFKAIQELKAEIDELKNK
jgi:hypothetical protein